MAEMLKLYESQFYSTKKYHKGFKFFWLNSVSLTANYNNFKIKKIFEKTSSKSKVTKVLSITTLKHFTLNQ